MSINHNGFSVRCYLSRSHSRSLRMNVSLFSDKLCSQRTNSDVAKSIWIIAFFFILGGYYYYSSPAPLRKADIRRIKFLVHFQPNKNMQKYSFPSTFFSFLSVISYLPCPRHNWMLWGHNVYFVAPSLHVAQHTTQYHLGETHLFHSLPLSPSPSFSLSVQDLIILHFNFFLSCFVVYTMSAMRLRTTEN